MTGRTQRLSLSRTAAIAVVAVPLALGLTGCSAIGKAVNAVKAIHNILHGSAAIDSLYDEIRAGDGAAYDVTYVTTGTSPATINYAADPPAEFAFDDKTSSGELRLFAGSTGQYECNRSGAAQWMCDKTDFSGVNTSKMAYALYSGAYWIDFLKIYCGVRPQLHGD